MKAFLHSKARVTSDLARRSALCFIVTTASLACAACVESHPYEHFVFLGEFEALEYDAPSKVMITGEDTFAVLYRLVRPDYALYAGIDKNAYVPTAVFWATGPQDESLTLEGTSIPCTAPFRELHENHYLLDVYPRGTLRLQWQPTEFGPCKNLPPADSISKKSVRLRVIAASGKVYEEDVEFRIAQNGHHWVIDAM